MSTDIAASGKADNKGPIILLSLKRSGSTLLRNILDAHPRIFGQALYIGPLCDALYNTSYLAESHASGNWGAGQLEEDRQRHAVTTTRKTIDGLLGAYVDPAGDRVWCDKSMENIDYLEIIDQVFPDARYVCLYRHCLDFVQSYLAMTRLRFPPEIFPYIRQRPGNVVAALAEYWMEKTSAMLEFEKNHPERCIRVNYERLVSEPNAALGGVFEFLGMDYDGALLDKLFASGGSGVAEGDIKFHMSEGIHTDSIGGGGNIPLQVIPKPMLNNLLGLLQNAGYQVSADDVLGLSQWGALGGGGADSSVVQIIDQFQQVIERKSDYAEKIGGKSQLVVNGEGGGVWLIDLTGARKTIRPGEGGADCVISLSSNTLRELAGKRISLVDAYQKGAIAIAGNMNLATSFGKLLLA